MANHEQAVIDGFNRFFQKQAFSLGKTVRTFALDGQDSIAGADYLLTDESRFSLVEFKYTQKQISGEKAKKRMLKLCKQLERDFDMAKLHDRCHFIAWTQAPEMLVNMNIYRKEVCNSQILGVECGLKNTKPEAISQVSAKKFTTEFFENNSSRTLSLTKFETYIAWLLATTSDNTKSTLELITYDEQSDDCKLIKFLSIREAHNWFQKKRPERKEE